MNLLINDYRVVRAKGSADQNESGCFERCGVATSQL